MDNVRNPFSPGAGSPPPELAGRDDVMVLADILLSRILSKRSEKSLILTGLRGVGKTVLLNKIESLAISKNYKTISVEAHSGKSLAALLVPQLRSLLFSLDRIANVGDKAKKALRVLKGFVGAINFKMQDFSVGIDIDSEKGTADSGDLEVDLPALFLSIAEAAIEKGVAVAIFIDEIQCFENVELSALIMAMHKMQQRVMPLVLVAAGLPILPGLAGESKTYAERLFNFPEIGALSKKDSDKALQDPVLHEGVKFSQEALNEVYKITKGYPYFIQEWGYQAWNHAIGTPISKQIIIDSSQIAITRLDKNFFRVRFDRVTPREKKYLRAMAGLGKGPYKTSDIATSLGVSINALAPLRASLIKKGMVYSPAYGEMDFTVPLFGEFMRRAIP